MFKHLLSFLLIAVWIVPANAQELKGDSLLPGIAGLFATNGTSISLADVSGQPFKKAYQVSTLNYTGNDGFSLNYKIDAAVQKGDVLLLSFYTRSLQSKKETGESFIEIFLNRIIDGKYTWPPLFERGMSFGSNWVLTQIPFVAARDVQKGELNFVIKAGRFQQVFELGAISLLNYKQSAKLADLPRSVVHYDGDAADAAWRKPAEDRIEKYRKGDLTIKVMDKNGKPAPGATVTVRLKKIAYAWGTATNSTILLDKVNPAFKIYRDTLLKYFNKVVFENEMKSKNWAKSDHDQTKRAVNWLKANNMDIRGHVMVWPGWQNSPHLVQYKNDTAALRAVILKIIDDQTTVMKHQFTEWDVVNEPFTNHNVMDSLGGKKLMLDWFHAARKNTPGVKLFLNDFTMFHTQGDGSQNFYDNIKYLKDNGAPIEAIGEQAHIGGTPPGIGFLIEKLDRFAKFGLPIQITEFDITSDDDDFKSRYIKDFLTAMFSHPSTIGVVQWGFWEGSHWIPAAALWDNNWNTRPEGKVYTELVSNTWNTNVTGQTAKNGTYKIRGFNGDYEIVVKKGNNEVIKQAVLGNDGKTLVVNFTN
ncbi:MAG: endo-1,4-beta-xylanase [Ferruginibacter sp.]|nr:endo-1,4-beta-xylanase [Ferruginibacter sp.]